MGFQLEVFVSSACYELRDLRASIKDWLAGHGLTPMMSDEGGFPHVDGMPPYATCLRVLEQCPLVIGVIDRHYGRPFDDWGPYAQYKGCSPTHAELRHALKLGKRLLLYVHNDTWSFYEIWRHNPGALKSADTPRGLDEATLQMFQELKQRQPAPWIERFGTVLDVLKSLNSEFVNQLYLQLRDREKQTEDLAAYVLEKVLDAAPDVREKVTAKAYRVFRLHLIRNELGGQGMAKQFSRTELYALVWSEPMKTLSGRFGISDVALKKTCVQAEIPTPDRGYWAKNRRGRARCRMRFQLVRPVWGMRSS